jgi:putative tryptophan/tyrosine transport system substrate-binding protein
MPRHRQEGMLIKFVIVLSAILLTAGVSVEAQQERKVYRVGFLAPGGSFTPSDEAFRESLRALGYSEGQNILLEWRFTKGDAERFPAFAAELVQHKVDCIVTRGIPAIRSAKQVTSTIPIVMVVNDDPVQMGLVDSLARPGRNVTGFAAIGAELAGKRLELLKETFPKVNRVGHLWGSLTGAAHLREIEAPARALGLQLQSLEVKGPGDLEGAFRTASRESDALIVVGAGWINVHRDRIINLAAKTRMPVMYTQLPFALEGGLISYAADETELWRRAAMYVDKVLKGVKPADLPVEQPTKFELVVNLKAAQQIGLTIPPNVLARADKVIK